MILAVHSGITWNLLPLVAALFAIGGVGSLLARILLVANDPRTPDENGKLSDSPRAAWGWSYLLGMAFIGLMLQFPLAMGGQISHGNFFGVLAICAAMTVLECLLRWRGRSVRQIQLGAVWQLAFESVTGWTKNLPLAIKLLTLVSVAIYLWFAAIKPPITYDARSIFGLKARILYDTGSLHGENFRDPDRLNFNANYPLLVPLVEAALFVAQGSQQDIGLQLLFTGFVLASASILVEAASRFESPGIAALWGACFLTLPLTLAASEGGGLSGSADYAFAAFTTAAVLASFRLIQKPNYSHAILAGLLLGAAVLTKQEASIWLLAIGVAFLATRALRGVKLRTATIFAGVGAGVIVLACTAIAALNREGIPASPYFRQFSAALRLEWLIHVWTRIPFILRFAAGELTNGQLFGFVWPFAAVALLLLRRPRASAEIIFYRSVVLGVAAAYFFVFMLTPLHLEYQLRTAFFRLSVHFLPLLMLVAAEQLAASGWSRQVQQLFANAAPAESNAELAAEFPSKTAADRNLKWNPPSRQISEQQQHARAA